MLKLYVKAMGLIETLKENKEGATIIEYSLLIGLLTVAVVALIAVVGPWLAAAWTNLCTNINTVLLPCAVP